MHDVSDATQCLTVSEWRAAQQLSGKPDRAAYARFLARPKHSDNAWITLLDDERLRAQLEVLDERLALAGGDVDRLPLYGVPFAVKDIIDVAGGRRRQRAQRIHT